ncbi:MAG: bifunctional metallophosphatase/5'-nucleotidase [Polyangiaceae bacterium]
MNVRILAINDFHGHLEPPAGSNGLVLAAADDPLASSVDARRLDSGLALVPTGGAAYLGAHLRRLRAESPNTVFVSAGDLTGASPLISNLFGDEPVVLVMNRLGLDFEGVGNHDFDRGWHELLRLQKGACARAECDGGAFPGASFAYLAANVIETATREPIFPPFAIRDLGGARVAFIGETLRQTPQITSASAVRGLSFEDEADAANALVPTLLGQGVSAIVLLLHQGGVQSPGGTYDSCQGLSGDVLPILKKLDPAIHIVVSAHAHQAYDCDVDGRVVTSAGSYGRIITTIDLTIDAGAHRIVAVRAKNVPVTHDVVPDPQVAAIVAEYAEKARGIATRVVGYLRHDLVGSARMAGRASCETPLGDVIADAMREATGADLALMNPGGIRSDLVAKRPGRPDFAVTYADAFEVQPFGNRLVVMTLTGADLRSLLEAQFTGRPEPRILQVSNGFSYRYAYDRAGRSAVLSDLRLKGQLVLPTSRLRVAVPSFLAAGGDGFERFISGIDPKEGPVDVDALLAFLGRASSSSSPFDPAPATRIEGDGCR